MGVNMYQKKVRTDRGWGNFFFLGGSIETGGSFTQILLKICHVWYQMKGNLIKNTVSDVHFVILSSCAKLHLNKDVVLVNKESAQFLKCKETIIIRLYDYSSSSLLSSSISIVSAPLEQCPQHTPHADTHDMPAFMQLHFIVWH